VALLAPTAPEYVPGGHGKHEVLRGDDEYVPAGHCVQAAAPAASAYEPSAHGTHVAFVVMPVYLEEVPAGHAVHDDAVFSETGL
jgi:hypothetical protein